MEINSTLILNIVTMVAGLILFGFTSYLSTRYKWRCFCDKEDNQNTNDNSGKLLHVYTTDSDNSNSNISSIRFDDIVIKPIPPPMYIPTFKLEEPIINGSFPARHSV